MPGALAAEGRRIVPDLGLAPGPAGDPLVDEHSVLLWEACAYADDLSASARSGQRLATALDAMLGFLHYRLLPYLTDEELHLSPDGLRDEHMGRLLAADHERLRTAVDVLESCRTPHLIGLAATALIMALERHVRREESWVVEASQRSDAGCRAPAQALGDWALPLVISDEIDLDALPAAGRDALIHQRLAWLRPGQAVRLTATHDLHPLWQRLHAWSGSSHVWAYDELGPTKWRVTVRRRASGDN